MLACPPDFSLEIAHNRFIDFLIAGSCRKA
jgi:hypothetical protein